MKTRKRFFKLVACKYCGGVAIARAQSQLYCKPCSKAIDLETRIKAGRRRALLERFRNEEQYSMEPKDLVKYVRDKYGL